MTAAIIFGLLIALMLTGMPISIALGLTVLIFLFTMTQVPIEAVGLKLFTGIENFEIMAIPFFILAGNFLTHGGVARRMINFATSIIGHWYGGLGLAGVMACALFAAVSGSSPATVVAIGSIVLPAMVQQGFPRRFGAGVITTSGALGILIPPSIVMVIYSVATSGSVVLGPDGQRVSSASIGQLFIAGVVPGIMLATMLGFTTWYRAWKNDYPRFMPEGGRSSIEATVSAFLGLVVSLAITILPVLLASLVLYPFGQSAADHGGLVLLANSAWLVACSIMFPKRVPMGFLAHEALKVWNSYWESIWGLLLIIIVMGGIYTGKFTPTEAAAMSAVYAFVIAVFVYRDMSLRDVPKALLASANMSAMILYIITNAVLFSFLMTSEQIPQALTSWIINSGLGWVGFLLVVNLLLLMAGNVMEPSSIVLITAPILFPIAAKLGINPVHFGIMIVVNMEVGMCHPPVGLNLYVASGITKMGITELTIAVWPWLLTMLVFLVIVTYIPQISLTLPRWLGML
jgi:C4-dicarboxylate transporter DctM subunit